MEDKHVVETTLVSLKAASAFAASALPGLRISETAARRSEASSRQYARETKLCRMCNRLRVPRSVQPRASSQKMFERNIIITRVHEVSNAPTAQSCTHTNTVDKSGRDQGRTRGINGGGEVRGAFQSRVRIHVKQTFTVPCVPTVQCPGLSLKVSFGFLCSSSFNADSRREPW